MCIRETACLQPHKCARRSQLSKPSEGTSCSPLYFTIYWCYLWPIKRYHPQWPRRKDDFRILQGQKEPNKSYLMLHSALSYLMLKWQSIFLIRLHSIHQIHIRTPISPLLWAKSTAGHAGDSSVLCHSLTPKRGLQK